LRAATPTAAAELATADRSALLENVGYLAERLNELLTRRLEAAQQTLDIYVQRLPSPSRQWQIRSQALDKNAARLLLASKVQFQRLDARLLANRRRLRFPSLAAKQQRLDGIRNALLQAFHSPFDRRALGLNAAAQAIELLGPPAVLRRGYAIVQNQVGAVITETNQVRSGNSIKVILSDGDLKAIVQ
jgi:exodeoxyribonuclease VII large subunit